MQILNKPFDLVVFNFNLKEIINTEATKNSENALNLIFLTMYFTSKIILSLESSELFCFLIEISKTALKLKSLNNNVLLNKRLIQISKDLIELVDNKLKNYKYLLNQNLDSILNK